MTLPLQLLEAQEPVVAPHQPEESSHVTPSGFAVGSR
jgi:hypothetical protein